MSENFRYLHIKKFFFLLHTMPRFRRRRRFPRRRGRFNRFLGGASKALAVAGTALATARAVKNLINVEFKQHEKTSAPNVTSAGSVHALTQIQVGDSYDDRDGRSVKLKSIGFKGYLTHNASGNAGQLCRLVIFRDTQGATDSALPGLNEALEGASLTAFRNYRYKGRFVLEWDKYFTLSADRPIIPIKWYKKLNNIVHYINDVGDETSDGDGSWYLGMISSQAAANYPTLNYTIRFKYLDN